VLNILYFVHGLKAQVSVARSLVARYTPPARLAGQGSAFWPVLGEPLGLLLRLSRSLSDLSLPWLFPTEANSISSPTSLLQCQRRRNAYEGTS